eukprot:snap_masked-scaffold_1-processed-gene-21.31-mRNA-1 protein AED:0.11 eAED:0.12 QI:0/0/0/1/1/1/4/0/319
MEKTFRTPNLHHYCAQFSPFPNNRILLSSSQYYGIVGNGVQYILQQTPTQIVELRKFLTNDAVLSSAWSEINPEQLVSACGDGSLKLWDIRSTDSFPIQSWTNFSQEVSSVDWNLISKKSFVATSHSGEIKLYDPFNPMPINGYLEKFTINKARWNPHFDQSFMIASGVTISVYDVRQNTLALQFETSFGEVLSCDWSKYKNFELVTCGATTEPVLKLWDIRNTKLPLKIFPGHKFGVRDVNDMTICLWNLAAQDGFNLVQKFSHHNEFVFGLDFNLFQPNQVASASWDENLCVFDLANPPQKIPHMGPVNQNNMKALK